MEFEETLLQESPTFEITAVIVYSYFYRIAATINKLIILYVFLSI